MLMMKERRPAFRTIEGWARSVLLDAGAIRECEEHGWMRGAWLDWRYLPGVPARGMSTLSEKGPRRLQAARQRRLDRADVPPAVECFAGKENRPTINS